MITLDGKGFVTRFPRRIKPEHRHIQLTAAQLVAAMMEWETETYAARKKTRAVLYQRKRRAAMKG